MPDTSDGQNARSHVLSDISRALAQPLDRCDVLRAVHAQLAQVLDVTMCFCGAYDATSENVEVVWQVHEGIELPGGHFPLGNGPTSEVIRSCQPRLIRSRSAGGPTVHVQYATEKPSLPESLLIVPVMYSGQVVGVLSLQSYAVAAYDEDDVQLLMGVADLIARALYTDQSPRPSDSDAILASMDDALLVLDREARVVRLNRAARRLLCNRNGGVIFGQPVDRPQDERWPLGSEELSRKLRPVVDGLERGDVPGEEMELPLDRGTVRCRASLLRKGSATAGAIMVLRETT